MSPGWALGIISLSAAIGVTLSRTARRPIRRNHLVDFGRVRFLGRTPGRPSTGAIWHISVLNLGTGMQLMANPFSLIVRRFSADMSFRQKR